MWKWLESFLYGSPTALIAVPPTEALAEQQAMTEARGRTSFIFDSHIMTEAASSKNPQAVSLAWDEGRAYGFNVAPQNWMGMTPRERKETLLSIFIANPWASNCIDTIGLYITSGGYTIEPRVGVENPDERQRDEIDAFLRRINEEWDFDQYIYDQITDQDIFGEAFTEYTMKDGKPYQLFPIDCLTMDTEHDKYGRVTRYKQQLTSTSEVNYLNPKTIIRWWNPHKRAKVDAFSPLEGIQDAILLDKKMTNWTTTFFAKGAKFPFSIEGITDQDEADRFLTWFKANYTGEKNAQTPFVAWGGATLKPMGKGSIDIDFDKGLDRQQAIVLAKFHVPPAIACISETGNRLTDMSDSQRKILQYIACDPRRRRFFEKFNYRLIAPYWSDWYVSSHYADFRDDEKLAKVADMRVRNGTRLIDEVRQEEGKDAYPDGAGQVPVIVVSRDVVPVPRIKDLEDEQRQAAQIAERQAQASADLAELKVQQAKEQPDEKNGAKPGNNAGNDEKSAADMGTKGKEEEEESQGKLRLDILNAFIDDIKRSGVALVINGESNAEQETHTQSNETDDVRPGPDQSESDGAVHQTEEAVGTDSSELDRGGSTAGEGEADGIADRQKAMLASWIADLFHDMKKRGASSSPDLTTAASAYTFSDAEQGELAQKLAELNVAAQRYAYQRDMVAVGLHPQIEEGLFSKVGDLITWGREQVSSIVETMHEMLTNFVSNLKSDSNIAEQVNGWIDHYADYKAPQVANVTWGTGANDGSMQAVEDILDAATDPNRPAAFSAEQVRIRVTPSYSSGDFCADYAGKDYSLNEYLQLGISWPAHPNCRHGIEIIRKDDGEA